MKSYSISEMLAKQKKEKPLETKPLESFARAKAEVDALKGVKKKGPSLNERSKSPLIKEEMSSINMRTVMADAEKRLILKALIQTDGNQKQAAELLQVPRTTLIAMMNRYNIPGAKEEATPAKGK